MTGEAVLAAIAERGRERSDALRRATAARIAEIEAEAAQRAAAARAEARAAALAPLAAERPAQLHQARLQALQIVGQAREEAVDAVLDGVAQRLAALRGTPQYPQVWRRLLQEALAALGQEATNGPLLLAMDLRDEALALEAVVELERQPDVAATLRTWGGVTVTSHDGRVVVDNTLEARLAHARPALRRRIIAALSAPEEAPGPAAVERIPAPP
ncbi:MAG: V-type ATP synthase subunit E [Candidatus Promineifilaceae bacterium]|nr:V-type ATP synthase subunit E [Candidatus Promineifilaceae bacterium]